MGIMEVYPSICSGWVYDICFEKLEQNPHIWSHWYFKPWIFYPKKPWKIPLLNQPFAGEPHLAAPRNPPGSQWYQSWRASRKKHRNGDVTWYNWTNDAWWSLQWFYVIFYILPKFGIEFWKMYGAVTSWYSQWVSNHWIRCILAALAFTLMFLCLQVPLAIPNLFFHSCQRNKSWG